MRVQDEGQRSSSMNTDRTKTTFQGSNKNNSPAATSDDDDEGGDEEGDNGDVVS